MNDDEGGPAFPRYEPAGGDRFTGPISEVRYKGMTLRDYFAAKALDTTLRASQSESGSYDYVAAAVGAYQLADVMLEERRTTVGVAEERERLVGKLSDTMDPENAREMVAQFERAVRRSR